MHDIRFIRENPEAFDAALARRGAFTADSIRHLDDQLRGYLAEREKHLADRNTKSREFGEYKRRGEIPPAALVGEIEFIKARLTALVENPNQNPETLQKRRDDLVAGIPNLPADDVPQGVDENENVIVHTRGSIRNLAFAPREHFDIGTALGLDFETAQKVSGARFAYLRGPVARLARALGQFMLDTHTGEFDYQEVNPPLLVRGEAFFGTGQLPKFAEDSFFAADMSNRARLFNQALGEDFEDWMTTQHDSGVSYRDAVNATLERADTVEQYWLIPTAEVSLTNIVSGEILAETEIPMRFTALTPCFRSEAGAAGKDTRGLIRQHQFDKVELVSITRPEDSEAEHERMTSCAEAILDRLELPYRRMLLCTGDMGFSARKTFDLEVWLPGQGKYREISSCSNCGDFQARRMNTRYRPEGEKGTRFVHTLNGSGLAVGRALVAVIENYQEADGSVTIPAVLRPYMGGIERISPQ